MAKHRRPKAAEQAGLSMTLHQLAASLSYEMRVVAGVEAACRVGTGPDGEQRIVMAVIELPGERSRWGAQAFGTVQIAQEDGSRWSVGDVDGWLQHDFPTLPAAVEALRDPARRTAMREFTDLVSRLCDLTRQVRQFPPVGGGAAVLLAGAGVVSADRRLTAAQLCLQHPECRPMEPIHQCAGQRPAMVPVMPGGPRVRGSVPCGQAARWRVFSPLRYRGTPPGFCTAHAAEVLRRHDQQACPVRAPLAAAKAAAERAWVAAGGGRGTAERALRAANTTLGEHDRGHACLMARAGG